MNINPDDYIVVERSALEELLAEEWTSTEAQGWMEEYEVPLMTLPEIQKSMIDNSFRWFPEAFANGLDITLTILGVVGEAGEVADVLKKYMRKSLTKEEFEERVAEESVDLFHYLCMLWVGLGIDVTEVYKTKTEFNEQRFGPKGE
jgi:NTP pyrophosphatase (non-canonical NTP hydrolase)